jgi:hypothetical protein
MPVNSFTVNWNLSARVLLLTNENGSDVGCGGAGGSE